LTIILRNKYIHSRAIEMKKVSEKEISGFIIENLEKNPETIARVTAEKFGLSRQSVNTYIHRLIEKGLIAAEGKTRNKRYRLKPVVEKAFALQIDPSLREDKVWRDFIAPVLKDGIKENIMAICHYGFTEMLNNVIDHSEAKSAVVELQYYPNKIELTISDKGVGIFKKLAKELNLDDERHAILELSKGKLTTDPERHTGEGIFFTSRIFDEFMLCSGTLAYSRTKDGNDFILDAKKEIKGTLVVMGIGTDSKTTTTAVFDEYANERLGFSKTYVAVRLTAYGDENLVSRSQAKRLLARLDRFREVIMNFDGVKFIGQAFADQIFRVFKTEHPEVNIIPVNENKDVKKMIKTIKSEAEHSKEEK